MRILLWLLGIIIVANIAGVYYYQVTNSNQSSSMTDDTLNTQTADDALMLTSSAFEHEGDIPAVYTCDGENISPALEIVGVSEEAQSLALIMDDPDAPMGTYDHWIMFNIPPDTTTLEEGSEPEGVAGRNSADKLGYFGPCPPGERHRYVFTLYVLDTTLELDEGASKDDVMEAMTGNILQKTELLGYYER